MASDSSVPVAELELRFAQQPNSDAFIPLAEAYLGQGRLMEAAVVCKKGLKGRPDSVTGRLLLVRVLEAQNKRPKALAELDGLIDHRPEDPEPRLMRARIRLQAGEREAGAQDLQAVLDLQPGHPRARALQSEHGLVPPPPAPRVSSAVRPGPFSSPEQTPLQHEPEASMGASSQVSVGPGSTLGAPPHGAPASAGLETAGLDTAGAPLSARSQHPVNGAPPSAARAPMRLEGEDELEALANRVAEERPPSGKPITTVLLLVVLMVVAGGVMGWRYLEKTKVEAIDRLTREALPAFRRDTYGGYLRAAQLFEEILRNHDSKHKLSLGRLAHAQAILWGEHGDKAREDQVRSAVAEAEAHAPQISHTVAARALLALYSAKERDVGMNAALDVLDPYLRQHAEEGIPPAATHVAKGVALIRGGAYEDAFNTLREAEGAMPSNVRAKVWLGIAARRAGRLSAASAALREALRLQPDHPGAHAQLTLTHLERGKLQAAATELLEFDEVRQANPKDVSDPTTALAEYARSEVARSAGQEAQGVGAYEMALRLDPTNSDFPYGLGRWMLNNGRAEEAIEPLSRAAEMEPSRPSIQVDLAEAQMQTGRYDEARKHIDAALARSPDFVPGLLARARLYRRTERPMGEVEAFLEELLKSHPTRVVDVKLELGRLHGQAGRMDLAQKELEEAIERMGTLPKRQQADVLLAYGNLMQKRGDWGTASNAYSKSAEMGDIEAYYRLAAGAFAAGDAEEAKKGCTRYLAAGSGLPFSQAAQQICDAVGAR